MSKEEERVWSGKNQFLTVTQNNLKKRSLIRYVNSERPINLAHKESYGIWNAITALRLLAPRSTEHWYVKDCDGYLKRPLEERFTPNDTLKQSQGIIFR
jgi:hypothetical protein